MHYNPSSAEFSGEGPNITLTKEEDTSLCSLANGGLDDGNLGENQNETPEDESLTRLQD